MIRHVTPVPRADATGVVVRVYEGLQREFGIHAEPITLHSPAPELLAAAWMLCREVTVADGVVDRAAKEALAVAVSEANRCPYCVDAHSAMGRSLGRPPSAPAPPYAEAEVPELVGTAVLFEYVNRPVSVFLDESPLPTRRLRGLMVPVASRRFRAFTRAPHAPGETLDLLPPAELPGDLGWAAGASHVGGAFARFAAAVERAGQAALPATVRAWLEQRLDRETEEDPGFGTSWVDGALAGLEDRHRPAGRLALLAAVAPYRVDDATIRAYAPAHDAQLLGAVCWAAFAVARRAGRRMSVDPGMARSSYGGDGWAASRA